MVNIPMQIRNADDYARIMNAAFVCAGIGMSIEQLKKQYLDLPNPKKTVKDILAIRAAYNAKNGGLDALKPCLEAVPDCSRNKPCFDKMKNTQNPEITGPKNYSTIVYDAYLCSGLFPPSLESLEKEYNTSSTPPYTWADARSSTGGPGIISDLRPCLKRIPPCSQQTPCLSKMKGIKMEIRDNLDYLAGMNAAFECMNWDWQRRRDELLQTQYPNLSDPKKTWADIISKRAKSDPIIPCLKAIKG
jgi:hypothetical protein